jgi:RimJ/RimL family protein N-acetyltransferase
MPIPRLETERLTLREIRPEDFEPYAAMLADAEVARFLRGGKPMSRRDAWRALASNIGQWSLRGYGPWAVERKSDGAFIGRVGLIHPDPWPGLEVGWTLGQEYWGRGYATEAARVSLNYAFLTLPVDEVIATIHPGNIASQKVAAKLGERCRYRTDIVAAGQVYTCDVWAISRAEWRRGTELAEAAP